LSGFLMIISFQEVAKNLEGFCFSFFFKLSYVVCSQIWLNHLMDARHFSDITKLQIK
jgi:hypothetical protein